MDGHMLKTRAGIAARWLGLTMVLAGCSPALNWRTVQLKNAPLQILLPCDAQTASRDVPMGSEQVSMAMVGCEADHATYAVSHFLLKEPAQAAETLARWQAAVLAQLHATKPLQAGGDAVFVPKGALNLPQSIRSTLEGVGPQGQKLIGHGAWFARLEGDKGVRIYHAVIYADKPRPEAAQAFFAGLQLQ